MKRILSVILFSALLVSILGGCTQGNSGSSSTLGSSKSSNPTSASSEAPNVPAPDPNKKYDISFYSYWCGELDDGSYCEKLIEDALNVDIQIRKVNNNNQEQINLMLASGDMPDVAWLDKSSSYMKEEELSRTIPLDMVKAYAPGFIEEYDKTPILYAEGLSLDDPEQFECLPGITDTYTQLYLSCDFYRYDWIEKLGIDLGVKVEQLSDNMYIAEKGPTKEKLREIMEKFVNEDPDGNSKKDTIGMSMQMYNRDIISSGYGFITDINNVNGKPVQWYAHPNYKSMLKDFQKMYADNLIDKEWLTQDRNAVWEKVNAGVVGYWVQSTNSLNSWAIDRPPLTLIAKNPQVKILMTPGLSSGDGTSVMRKAPSPRSGMCYVNAKMQDDQKLAKILQVLQYGNFGDTENADVLPSLWYGEKDVNWKWDEAGKAPVVTNPVLNGVNGTKVFPQFMQVRDLWRWMTFEPLFAKGSKYYVKDDGGIWNQNLVYPYKADLQSKTEYSKLLAEHKGDIDNIVNTYYMDCMLGKNDIDATWDKYLKDLDDSGYGDLMTELDKLEPFEDLIKEYAN